MWIRTSRLQRSTQTDCVSDFSGGGDQLPDKLKQEKRGLVGLTVLQGLRSHDGRASDVCSAACSYSCRLRSKRTGPGVGTGYSHQKPGPGGDLHQLGTTSQLGNSPTASSAGAPVLIACVWRVGPLHIQTEPLLRSWTSICETLSLDPLTQTHDQ